MESRSTSLVSLSAQCSLQETSLGQGFVPFERLESMQPVNYFLRPFRTGADVAPIPRLVHSAQYQCSGSGCFKFTHGRWNWHRLVNARRLTQVRYSPIGRDIQHCRMQSSRHSLVSGRNSRVLCLLHRPLLPHLRPPPPHPPRPGSLPCIPSRNHLLPKILLASCVGHAQLTSSRTVQVTES